MTTLTLPYRDDTEGARIRYDELRSQWDDARVALSGVVSVHTRRTARIWAGNAGIAGAVAIATTSAARFLGGMNELVGVPTALLPASWIAMAVAYAAGVAAGEARMRGFIDPPRPTGDPRADARRLADALPEIDQRERADALERSSVSRPLIAVGLLMPLSIHLAFYAFFRRGDLGPLSGGFDTWIAASLVIVGHAHMALAYLAWRFARVVRGAITEDVMKGIAGSGWRVWGITVLVSAIPSGLLYLIPPALTGVTGVLYIPLMFGWMTRRVVRERLALGVAQHLC